MAKYIELEFSFPPAVARQLAAKPDPFGDGDLMIFQAQGGVTVALPAVEGTYGAAIIDGIDATRHALRVLLDSEWLPPHPWRVQAVDSASMEENLLLSARYGERDMDTPEVPPTEAAAA